MEFNFPVEEAERLFKEYEFLERLPASAQKAAFRVRDRANGAELCLKIINPDSNLLYINREIQALTQFNHKNVARLHRCIDESTEAGRRHCIIEHFIPGGDLTAKMTPGEPWDLKEAARFFIGVFDGLSHLASHQLVHRDLKPSNIRVHVDGHPVLIDFGLARHLSLPDLTKTGEAQRGNLAHFAPEQWQSERRLIDPRTDLFAAGIILYNMVLGRHPFIRPEIRTADDLREAVLEGKAHLEAPDFQALPRPWTILLSKLLERGLAGRPANAALVVNRLQRILEAA